MISDFVDVTVTLAPLPDDKRTAADIAGYIIAHQHEMDLHTYSREVELMVERAVIEVLSGDLATGTIADMDRAFELLGRVLATCHGGLPHDVMNVAQRGPRSIDATLHTHCQRCGLSVLVEVAP